MAVPAIIVQGGGFGIIANLDIQREQTKRAASVGYDVLINGGTAVDAAEKVVRVFEEHGHFNAGRGSCLNVSGEVECDAMIMDGNNMKTGAVITARHFLHPVSIARKIMDESPHCALSGEGALEFARSINFDEICDPEELRGDYPYQQITNVRNQNFDGFAGVIFTGQPVQNVDQQQAHDTVGAVAIDREGFLACANSTGGIHGKLKGRVSDASLVGCGGYANKFGAAATTGPGEDIMKMCLAKEVVSSMEIGLNAQEAAEKALDRMKDCVGAVGGVIAIDQTGNFGKAFSICATKKNDNLEFHLYTA